MSFKSSEVCAIQNFMCKTFQNLQVFLVLSTPLSLAFQAYPIFPQFLSFPFEDSKFPMENEFMDFDKRNFGLIFCWHIFYLVIFACLADEGPSRYCNIFYNPCGLIEPQQSKCSDLPADLLILSFVTLCLDCRMWPCRNPTISWHQYSVCNFFSTFAFPTSFWGTNCIP